MHHSLKIKRGTNDFFADPADPITKEQWHSAIKNHPKFEFDIGLERSDYDYAELNDEDGSWVHFEDNGTLTAENPTPMLIFHLLQLADDLNAIVCGEDSEVYHLSGDDFFLRTSRLGEERVHWWRRVETERGIDYISEDEFADT